MIQTIMVAERATIEHFSLDRIMNAIVKAFETVNEPTVVNDDPIHIRGLGR